MGQLMKPLRAAPEVMTEREWPIDAAPAQPAPTVVMIALPNALNDKRVWAAGFVALIVLLVGLFAIFGGDGQAVIEAQQAHIESLERVTDRVAEVAEAAVSVDRSAASISQATILDGVATGLTIILIGVAAALFIITGIVTR